MVNQIKRIMKELSIEEKAKAYDKALERAIKLKEDPQSVFYEYSPNEGDTICDYIFPELKESEDERMMNQLHSWMKEFGGAEEYTEKVYLWLKGLLEKQGKQKETLCDKCKKTQPSHSCQDITALGRCALEKQGEQKLTEFEKAVKQVMEEAIECGDTHNLKADADMLLSLVQKYVDNGEHKFLTVERAKRIIK